MAWDALANRFKPRTQEDQNLGQEFKPLQTSGQSSGGASFNPTPNPTGGFGGDGGSTTGGPVSAGFVNYGDLYKANEEKAKGMASGVYKGAEKKAEDAKKNVADAQKTFAEKAAANAGNWRPIGGAHGTRLPSGGASGGGGTGEYGGATDTQEEGKGSSGVSWDDWRRQVNSGTGRPFEYYAQDEDDMGQSRDAGTGEATRGKADPGNYSGSGGTMTGGASRYSQLYGPVSTMGSVGGKDSEVPDKAGLADYHAYTDMLGAQSGAKQDYTGPKSLKESMGDEAYGKAADELKKAGDGIAGLQNSGGIAEALGYAGDNTGNAAMDAGLTQTAGQSNFKRLADRYGNLGKTLDDAQTNSIADAGRADADSAAAAKAWQDIIDEYEGKSKPGSDAANASTPTGKNTSYGNVSFQTGNGFDTNANTVTSAGYDAAELQDLVNSGELTQDEWDWLNSMSSDAIPLLGGFGQVVGGWTGNTDPAAIQQNILAKLSKRRAAKNGAQ